MFRYLTSYRFYTLAKVGLSLAYLWFSWDFFSIHVALWGQLSLLLPVSDHDGFSVLLNSKVVIWSLFVMSPFVAAAHVWGRYKWLQFAVGIWMSIGMVIMISSAGIFASTADVWLHFIFLAYSLTALSCPSSQWDQLEPGLDLAKWKKDPVIASNYAWLVVLIQFIVYLFAGINKLVDGWAPWTTGVALQHLAFDSSMRDSIRGIYVPYWISLIFCYVTLFQRLVVPFGFYFMRYRGWSVLILGSMHIGYYLLMKVAIFPLIGVSSLLMIIPPRSLALPWLSRPSLRQPPEIKKLVRRLQPVSSFQAAIAVTFLLLLFLESTRLTVLEAVPWEKSWMVVPAWRMFADGGVAAGEKWKLLLQTPQGEVDATDIALCTLPHLWRDRFYIDSILHGIPKGTTFSIGRATPVGQLILAAGKLYGERQLQAHRNPAVLGVRFVVYRDPVAERFFSSR